MGKRPQALKPESRACTERGPKRIALPRHCKRRIKRKKENLEAPQTHAPPWKSGASAPRPPSQNQPGFSPCGRRSRATCCEGACPELAEEWDSTTSPLRILQRHGREGHDFLPQHHHKPTHHRGRAALQRRVPASQTQPGFSPCGRRSRAKCCKGACPELAEGWDSTTPPLRTLGAPRPGRARLHSCRKTAATARTTVEERRFSAASTIPKPTGLQPLWTPFVLHVAKEPVPSLPKSGIPRLHL